MASNLPLFHVTEFELSDFWEHGQLEFDRIPSPTLVSQTTNAATDLYMFESETKRLAGWFINSSGELIQIIMPEQSQSTSGFSDLHFLGLYATDAADPVTVPFFTDTIFLSQTEKSALDKADISLVGIIKKASCDLPTSIYVKNSETSQDDMRLSMSKISIADVSLICNNNYTAATYQYVVADDDFRFDLPWNESRAVVFPLPELRAPGPAAPEASVSSLPKRVRGESSANDGSSAKRVKTSSAVVSVPDSPVALKKLTINSLKKFPQYRVLARWAKGHYRSRCLYEAPYLEKPLEKAALAEKAYDIAAKDHKITETYSNTPNNMHTLMIALIWGEHNTFRSHSIECAKAVVNAIFPPNLGITEAVTMLQTICGSEYINNFVNFQESSSNSNSDSQLESASCTYNVNLPLSHRMVLDLLVQLFGQKIKYCRKDLRELLVNESGPLPIVTCVYGLSLLFDALVNRFREELVKLSVQITDTIVPQLAVARVASDAYRYKDFLALWLSCERSDPEKRGERLRTAWGNTIFPADSSS